MIASECSCVLRMQETLPGEVLKAVFPLLVGQDLASCMCVCKQWRDLAKDDYLWKQLCARRWPSVCSTQGALTQVSSNPYFSLYSRFSTRPRIRTTPSPKLTFDDLEFYLDIWAGTSPLFSTVVPGSLVRNRVETFPEGIDDSMQYHLQSDTYKLTMAVSPSFSVQLPNCHVSLLLRRRDDRRVACIIDKSCFEYRDLHGSMALAFDYLQISPLYPFVSQIRAWVALLLLDAEGDSAEVDSAEGDSTEPQEVFVIELDFADAATCDREVLCLLEILDWKAID